ncbi:MAG: glycosyl transferase, partial [Caulobacteraceae bacterium]|nr:glycosyl transferase [Caulobacteraceae bacterium]
ERVLPRDLLADNAQEMKTLPRWAAEAFINDEIIRRQLRLAVVSWPGVRHTPKRFKVGSRMAVTENLNMINDALEVLQPMGVVRQNLALLKLSRRYRDEAAAS